MVEARNKVLHPPVRFSHFCPAPPSSHPILFNCRAQVGVSAHTLPEFAALQEAVMMNKPEVAQMLVDAGANGTATPLLWAAVAG